MLSKSEFVAFRNQAFLLAAHIGLRPAGRALGISEERIKKWSQRYNWQISKLRPNATNATLSPNAPTPLEAMQNVMAQMGDRTRLAMGRSAMRAFEHTDTLDEKALLNLQTSIALEKHAKVAQLAHGWRADAGAQVAVQVNVPMPTQAERDEMRRLDDKLDAIAAKLKARSA